MTSIAFIGVGRMGSPMAGRLVAAGHQVSVFDLDATAVASAVARGAVAGTDAVALQAAADITIASLPTPAIVERVASSFESAAADHGQIFVDMSTTGAPAAARVAEILAAKNIAMVDAPISGGIKGAEKGTLAISASGPRAAVERATPVLEQLGRVFFVGEKPGQGQTVKLINNLLSGAAMAISAEAVVMAEKAGLDVAQVLEIINSGSGRNSATADKILHHVLPRTFDYGFGLSLLDKDVRLCMAEAEVLGVPMVVGTAVRQLLAISRGTEGEDADVTDVVRTIERWANTEVCGKRG
jgi:3-hydroxyisobutyrate dehydrogenase-like beta-hydroxyacid dehydrogenase